MKGKINFFIALITGCLVIAPSCKKSSGNINNGTNTSALVVANRIKMMTIIQTPSNLQPDTSINLYEYDNQNRLSTCIQEAFYSGTAPRVDSFNYTYSNDSVTRIGSDGTYYVFLLNSQGYEASDNNGDTWTYNSAGYLTSSSVTLSSTTYAYTYISNQLATEKSQQGTLSHTYTFTYPSSGGLANNASYWGYGLINGFAPGLPSGQSCVYPGLPQSGMESGSLFTSYTDAQNGGTTTYNATYSPDSQGRLSSAVINPTGNGTKTVANYTYY